MGMGRYGLSVPSATFVMTAFSLGGIAGQTVGGAAGQALYNRSSRLPALLMLVAGALGVLPMWGLLTARGEWSAGRCAAAAALGGFFATQTGPNVPCTRPPAARACLECMPHARGSAQCRRLACGCTHMHTHTHTHEAPRPPPSRRDRRSSSRQVRATLINVTQSEQRGLGFAAFALADDLGKRRMVNVAVLARPHRASTGSSACI
tara:strand:- start:586 stop:1203 length:618 start_codon:yes stop_codon:yes gene_type:complete